MIPAKSVEGLDELYGPTCTDWKFSFMPKGTCKKEYILVFSLIEATQQEPDSKDCDLVFGPPTVELNINLEKTRTPAMHWYKLLCTYASHIQTLVIYGSKLDDKKNPIEFQEFDMKKAEHAEAVKKLMDYASLIFTYNQERAFALIRRIMDDNTLAGLPPSIDPPYVRQSPNYFREGDMIHWRNKCHDVCSHFATKKTNRDLTVGELLLHHTQNADEVDSRGGVFHVYQAILFTYVDKVKWAKLT